MSLSEISGKFTVDTLDEIIRNCGGKNHTTWEFGTSFNKGDFYISQLHRLNVTGVKENGETFTVKVIVKSLPMNHSHRKTFRSAEFFRNEILFFSKIFPTFFQFQEKYQVSDPFNEIPKCLASYMDGENDFIALEDLTVYGYQQAERQNGMDLYHIELAMRTFGRFHGVSLAMKHKEPEMFEEMLKDIRETYYGPQYRDWYKKALDRQTVVILDAITKEFGGTVYERAIQDLVLKQDVYGIQIDLIQSKNDYSVIGHGDGWAPNFLMKYEDRNGKSVPIANKLIDFQLGRYGSPIFDLSILIYSCTTQELREKHFDHILKVYYNALSDLLKEFKCDPNVCFSWDAFMNEWKRAGKFGFIFCMEALPLSMLDTDETADLNAIDETSDTPDLTDYWNYVPITVPENRRRLADTFKDAYDRGFIN